MSSGKSLLISAGVGRAASVRVIRQYNRGVKSIVEIVDAQMEIVGLETSRIRPPGGTETPPPTLTFSVSTSRGELDIVE